MGSKLHRINRLFTTLKRKNCNVVTVGLKDSDTEAASEKIALKTGVLSGLNQLKASMDGLLECDRDSVRNTMLKHNEIFRHQVQELHRVYRVQKVLMTELGKKKVTAAMADARTTTRIWSNSASTSDTSRSSQVSNIRARTAGMSSRELSICSLDRSNAHCRGFDLEQPAAAEEYTSKVAAAAVHGKQLNREAAGSSEVPLSWSDDGSEIELTLSIGCGQIKKKSTHSLHPNVDIVGCSDSIPGDTRSLLSTRPVMRQGRGEECVDSSAGLDRESLKSPPWLLQALNLNKT